MASTFTTALNLEKPGSGDFVGTWDAPVNANYDVVDAGMGQTATISGAAGSIVLSAAQFRSAQITFNSTLLASITATFPSTFTKGYAIYHTCTGSSAFTITLQTTAAGGEAIAVPPGVICDVWNDGTSLRFRNLGGPVGSYWDYAGSSVPAWNDGCTKKPWLNCDGTTFSSGTYPQLFAILGSTTLPDLRGRYRATLNQGTGRLQSSVCGLDGETRGANGGTVLVSSQMLPSTAFSTDHTHAYRDRYYIENVATFPSTFLGGGAPFKEAIPAGYNANFGSAASDQDNNEWAYYDTVTSPSTFTFGSSSPSGIVPPTAIGGLTLIRAA